MKKILNIIFFTWGIVFQVSAEGVSLPTNKNVLNDYLNNKASFSSEGHPKAFGLNVEIEYPKNWIAKEGKRAHVTQKFIENNNKANCMLLIKKSPLMLSRDEWNILTYDVESIKEGLIEEYNEIENIKIIPTKYENQPGNLIEYSMNMSRAGYTIFANCVQHVFYYRDNIIGLHCFAYGKNREEVSNNTKIFNPLFKAMGNDIILHNIHTDNFIFDTDIISNTSDISNTDFSEKDKLYDMDVLLSNVVDKETAEIITELIHELKIEKEIKDIFQSKIPREQKMLEVMKLTEDTLAAYFLVMSGEHIYSTILEEIKSLEKLKESGEICLFGKASNNSKENLSLKLKYIKLTKKKPEKKLVIMTEDEFTELYSDLLDLYRNATNFDNILKLEYGKIDEIPKDKLCDTRIERLKIQQKIGKDKFSLLYKYVIYNKNPIAVKKIQSLYPGISLIKDGENYEETEYNELDTETEKILNDVMNKYLLK